MSQPARRPATETAQNVWSRLQEEAIAMQANEPALARFVDTTIIGATSFTCAIGNLLSEKLSSRELNANQLRDLFTASRKNGTPLDAMACRDLMAVVSRDPAAGELLIPFLFFKGFHALQSYRLANWLWRHDRTHLAYCLQNRISDVFAVDIHPAAKIGSGVMMDHATGIVIGETAVVEDDVSMLHAVTLGGTGKESGDRHPKIRTGVLIGAGAKILGNIEVGAGARVAAGSVVLQNVPPGKTVAGVPAKVIGDAGCAKPAQEMDQMLSGDGAYI